MIIQKKQRYYIQEVDCLTGKEDEKGRNRILTQYVTETTWYVLLIPIFSTRVITASSQKGAIMLKTVTYNTETHVLVPREPTEKWRLKLATGDCEWDTAYDVIRAVINAAPEYTEDTKENKLLDAIQKRNNPRIPYGSCFKCGIETNEIWCVKGIGHYKCLMENEK